MNTVLATIDGGSASVAVLDVGSGISEAVNGRLEVLHVDVGAPLRALFHTQGLQASLTITRGDAVGEIVRSAARSEVAFLVIALRNRVLAPEPVGRTTGAVIPHVLKGVIVVPPVIAPWPDHPHIRVLVPARGEAKPPTSASPSLQLLSEAGAEIIVTRLGHDSRDYEVNDAGGNRSSHTTRTQPSWAGTFPSAVVAAAEEKHADLIAFRWTQPNDLAAGAIARAVMACSRTPVLLLPAFPDPNER